MDPRIDVERARQMDDVVWLDTRGPNSYAEATEQIPGSIRMPADEADQFVRRLPKGRPIVAYCT